MNSKQLPPDPQIHFCEKTSLPSKLRPRSVSAVPRSTTKNFSESWGAATAFAPTAQMDENLHWQRASNPAGRSMALAVKVAGSTTKIFSELQGAAAAFAPTAQMDENLHWQRASNPAGRSMALAVKVAGSTHQNLLRIARRSHSFCTHCANGPKTYRDDMHRTLQEGQWH